MMGSERALGWCERGLALAVALFALVVVGALVAGAAFLAMADRRVGRNLGSARNAALAAGDLDANSYQHQPYLDDQIATRGYKFVSIGQTITFPMGVYSKKIKLLKDLKDGARFGLPNDPTNGGRALLLLQAQGVIKLKPNAGFKASPRDVAENPKKLKFVELDAAQLPRSLDDLDAAAVNGNYAEKAGLDPIKDGIAIESPKGPYANVIAIRTADKDQPWVAKLVKAYHSDTVKAFVKTKYKDAVIVAW